MLFTPDEPIKANGAIYKAGAGAVEQKLKTQLLCLSRQTSEPISNSTTKGTVDIDNRSPYV